MRKQVAFYVVHFMSTYCNFEILFVLEFLFCLEKKTMSSLSYVLFILKCFNFVFSFRWVATSQHQRRLGLMQSRDFWRLKSTFCKCGLLFCTRGVWIPRFALSFLVDLLLCIAMVESSTEGQKTSSVKESRAAMSMIIWRFYFQSRNQG